MRHNFYIYKRTYLIFLLLFFQFTIFNGAKWPEYISLFESEIKVNEDRSLTIKENITYDLEQNLEKHVIIREFPTKYQTKFGIKYNIGFEVKKILINDNPVSYQIKNIANGKRIFIGDPEKILSPGIYKYTIIYNTTHQLGFFKEHDELYFNITGNDWRIPIKKATAKIIFPENIRNKITSIEGYTGYQDQKGTDYNVKKEEDGTIFFVTTKELLPGQGLTIAIAWPKGLIKEPTTFEKTYRFFSDNLTIIWLLLGLIILILFYLGSYIYIKSKQPKEPIIPLFEPPENLSPAEVRYLYNFGFDAKVLAAEIIHMAVTGLLTIEYVKGWLFGGTYILRRTKKEASENLHKALIKLLFEKDTIKLDKSNRNIITNTVNKLKKYLDNLLSSKYFDYNLSFNFIGAFISGFFIFTTFLFKSFQNYDISIVDIIIISLLVIIEFIFFFILRNYTPPGKRLVSKIKGFRLFLTVTETERLKIIGTPPTKTPELFETYLPYAVALDAEKQWSDQFVPIFKEFEKEEKIYQPTWIIGPSIRITNMPYFYSHLTSSITSSAAQISGLKSFVVAAPTPPGTTPGTGGRGGAGRGGGGGGGGSW